MKAVVNDKHSQRSSIALRLVHTEGGKRRGGNAGKTSSPGGESGRKTTRQGRSLSEQFFAACRGSLLCRSQSERHAAEAQWWCGCTFGRSTDTSWWHVHKIARCPPSLPRGQTKKASGLNRFTHSPPRRFGNPALPRRLRCE